MTKTAVKDVLTLLILENGLWGFSQREGKVVYVNVLTLLILENGLWGHVHEGLRPHLTRS